jgi:hypothetical protein
MYELLDLTINQSMVAYMLSTNLFLFDRDCFISNLHKITLLFYFFVLSMPSYVILR